MSLPRIFVLASILLGISLGPVSATSPFDTSVVQIAVNHTDSAITEKTIKRIYSSGTPREQLDFFKRLLRGTGVEADPKRAMGFLRRAAERGFAPAQHQMALYHIKGTKFVAKNVADAVKWYRKAAQQDYAVSQRILGRLLEQGLLVKKDYTEAGKWYLKAAAQGDRRAQVYLGALYERGRGVPKNFGETKKWYQTAAEKGFSRAQYTLARMYWFGRGTPKDFKAAAKWYRKSADKNYAKAQSSLGYLYQLGRGVPKSFKEAANWYRKAALKGHYIAQTRLGTLYSNGTGVKKDFAEAYFWHALVVKRSKGKTRKTALNLSSAVKKKLTSAQISKIKNRVAVWRRGSRK